MRNWPVYVLVALGVLGALLMFLSEVEPALTAREMASAICPTPRAPFGREMLARHLAERVELVIGGEESTLERAGLLERVGALRAAYPSCSLDLVDVNASRGEGDEALGLRGELEYSESEASDLHAARRRFEATFQKRGEHYLLQRIELGPLRRTPPEARP